MYSVYNAIIWNYYKVINEYLLGQVPTTHSSEFSHCEISLGFILCFNS